ncbi:hypothetical protein N7474_009002 [Penicillium riverlandense]|uniref:uncharacterized protein n=1 Tax=Penicillium riverlandense TaxID=1903569 RepID=UPI002546B01C|nr:uncharacterized protein N7474_009002 [Penicillium riverlandense]KAJ5807733.1 hypothetical protein N7474_009002 [Penicillium riverlandense]
MPSFESTQLVKKDSGNSDGLISCDRHNGSYRSSVRSHTSPAEEDSNGKAGFLKRTWKHCKRPGSALVARHFAQPILAKSSLSLLSTSLHNPTPNTVDFSMRVTLTLPVPFPVLLEPMVVRLCRNGHAPNNPFLEVTLPACQIVRSADIEVIRKTTNILDVEQFGDFINDVMFKKSVILDIKGSAKVQDGAHLEAVLDLPNPSLATIEMGDLTLNLYVGSVLVGEVFISNVTFTPGPNVVSSRVYLDPKTAVRNITTIIQSQKESLYRGKLGVRVSGKSTVRNGENLAYFENGLSKLQLYSMVPVSRILGSTVGGIATSITPGNILMLLRMTGIMARLEGNGVDVAQITQLGQPA